MDADRCGFEWRTSWPDEEFHLCRLDRGHADEHECTCGRSVSDEPTATQPMESPQNE